MFPEKSYYLRAPSDVLVIFTFFRLNRKYYDRQDLVLRTDMVSLLLPRQASTFCVYKISGQLVRQRWAQWPDGLGPYWLWPGVRWQEAPACPLAPRLGSECQHIPGAGGIRWEF